MQHRQVLKVGCHELHTKVGLKGPTESRAVFVRVGHGCQMNCDVNEILCAAPAAGMTSAETAQYAVPPRYLKQPLQSPSGTNSGRPPTSALMPGPKKLSILFSRVSHMSSVICSFVSNSSTSVYMPSRASSRTPLSTGVSLQSQRHSK